MSGKPDSTPPLAVALHYDGVNAPRVTATGEGETARQILAAAIEHGVPLQYEPALAAVLATLEPGEEIPPALYAAVAQVIAFAYSLSGKMPPAAPES